MHAGKLLAYDGGFSPSSPFLSVPFLILFSSLPFLSSGSLYVVWTDWIICLGATSVLLIKILTL